MRDLSNFHRKFAYPIVFGGLWGVWELSLGSLLHLSHFPFKGIVMTSGAVIIALVGKSFSHQRWSIVEMGVIAAFLRLLAPGGIFISPMIAILLEAFFLEGTIIVLSRRPISYGIAGAITFLLPPIHSLIFQGLIFGRKIYALYLNILERGISSLGVNLDPLLLIIFFAFLLMIIGFITGSLAWAIGENTRERLGWTVES